MLFELSTQNSIASEFLLELREKVIQQDRMRFKLNLERLGQIMAYEVSKKLQFEEVEIETPLSKTKAHRLMKQPVLLTILRAGIPYFNGFNNYFDGADCGFIGAYRKEGAKKLTIKLDYIATPDLTGRDVILIDPMLATGQSIADSLELLKDRGKPNHVFIVCLVAAPEGLKHIEENVKISHSVWCVALDKKLNEKSYIVPGLGDAGDLSFGEKL